MRAGNRLETQRTELLMSEEPADTDAEQHTTNPLITRDLAERLGVLAVGTVLGLVVNSLIILAIVGGDALGIADGVAFLAPALIIAVWVDDRYNPARDVRFLGPFVLLIIMLMANTVSLGARVYRMGAQSDPVMTALLVGFLAVMFTPGAFLGAWAARRWWL